tara:strand:+ start:260 stop:529 length:270 start_codon:yes stop_codon:yes gene_type:complete
MAFRGNSFKKKKKKLDIYAYPYTKDDMKRVSWCIDRNIEIAVIPSDNYWIVEIRMNKGKWKQDPKQYEYGEAMKKLYEYYKYYYDKYNI